MRSIHDIAADYCSWVERSAEHPNLAQWLPRILAELIHAAFSLPDDGLADAVAEDFQRRDYQQIRAELPSLPFQYYGEVLEPLDLEAADETGFGDLYDDLADIYGDLSEGLFIHRHGSPTEAERYWSQSFRFHWGKHATGALRALYCARRHQPETPSRAL